MYSYYGITTLEGLAAGLRTDLASLVATAYQFNDHPPLLKPEYFIDDAPLPPGLTVRELSAAFNETHKIIRLVNSTLIKVVGRPLPGFIQGNNFSGIVSNILCDSFSCLTAYKHNHDQRYPDLVCKGKDGKTECGLEVKSTIRPGKGGESHNGHSGWHVIACFSLNAETGDIRFIHVMFADLVGHGKPGADWAYVGSKVNKDTGSQRTETYNTTPLGTAKLRHGTAYLDASAINISRWRTALVHSAPASSPFIKILPTKVVRKP